MSVWRNAFKISSGRDLTNEEMDLLTKAAFKIREKKLQDIALLLIEGTKPFHNLAANMMYFSKPVLGFIFSHEEINRIAQILENPKGVEFFKSKIEEGEDGR